MGQRVVALAFGVAFVAGMNFFCLLNFWPLTISRVWDPIPLKIGLRGLSAGFATAIGAIFWNGKSRTYVTPSSDGSTLNMDIKLTGK